MARATSPNSPAEHFLPHIQGLRAIAVLLVVLYHFWPSRITGGYIGVDVFFVISGFLISGQLARELASSDTIALATFWAKRVRRLVPASLVVLIVSIIVTAFVMPLAYVHDSLWDIAASALYVQNWHLVAGAVNYLASEGHTIAEHYWSLSLEEQFYVVWPLILLVTFASGARLAARRRGILLATVVVIVGLLSLVASIYFTATNPGQAYFMLFTRMWEFAAGALLVFIPRLVPAKPWLRNVLGLGGIITILASAVVLTAESPFPGWIALVPVLGTVAVIAAAPAARGFSVTRILTVRPVTFIGDISYSLYLWHWPLIIAAPFIIGWGTGTVNRIALFVGAFILAWLTKRFVEDPFRRLPALVSRKPRFTFGWMLVALGLVGALLIGTYAYTQPKYEAAAAELAEVTVNPPACFGAEVASGCSNPQLADAIIPDPGFGSADQPGNDDCFVQLNNSDLVTCTFGSSSASAPRIALIGDSHAYQYIDSLARQAEINGWSLTTYLKGACPWASADPLDSNPAFVASCRDFRANLASELASVAPYDVIVTAAYSQALVDAAGSADAAAADLSATWAAQSRGATVLAIADNPVTDSDPNNCLRAALPAECAFPRDGAMVAPDPLVRAAALTPGAQTVDFTKTFCSASTCSVVISGANVYRDQDHLTATFANTMGPRIAEAIRAALAPVTTRR